MNKFLFILTLPLLLGKLSFSSIPVLNQSNSAPAVGDVITLYPVDTAIVEGPSGAFQSWVYNNLITSSPNTTNAVDVISTPFAINFPDANVAMDDGIAFEFSNSSATSLKQMGNASGSQVINFTTGIDLLTYPFTFNSTCDNLNFIGIHTSGTLIGNSTSTCDAHGSLTLNGVSYPEVIRIKIVQDIDYDYIASGHLIFHKVSYLWYDGNNKSPLLEITTIDASGIVIDHTKQVFIGSSTTAVKEASGSLINFDIFPNPAHDQLNISFSINKSDNANVKIYNTAGSILLMKDLGKFDSAVKTETIDLSSLARGVYFVSVTSSELKETKKIIVE